MRCGLFQDFTQPTVAVSYRRFGISYRSHLQGSSSRRLLCPEVSGKHICPISWVKQSWSAWPFKMRPIVSPETSVRKYRFTLREISKERSSHVHRGGNLNSRVFISLLEIIIYL